MWPEEYWLLSKYVDLTEGDYLEIGSMCGVIAMSFAEKYPRRRFVCVDKFSAGHGTIAGERETFLQNMREHDLKNVSLVEGDSLTVVPKLSQTFDMIFIDGNHAYDYVLGDATNSWSLLSPGGFLAFHDYRYVEETTRAVTECLKRTGAIFLESASSLAIVHKPADSAQSEPCLRRTEIGEIRALLKQQQDEVARVRQELESQQVELASVRQQLESRETDVDWLLESIKRREQEIGLLRGEKAQSVALCEAVQNSAGWRMLNVCRRVRDSLAPSGTRRRKFYDLVRGNFRR